MKTRYWVALAFAALLAVLCHQAFAQAVYTTGAPSYTQTTTGTVCMTWDGVPGPPWHSVPCTSTSLHRLIAAASTNATVMKAAPGTLLTMTMLNTTTTVYYLKFYNKATTPTCNTDTVVWGPFPIPYGASNAGGGFVISMPAAGAAFSTGIAYCITGGSADNDNTNAATGLFVNATYR